MSGLFGLRATTAMVMAIGLQSNAMAAERQKIDVPSQPLLSALNELGTETGYQISAKENLVAQKRSASVSGMMTPAEALSQM